MGRILLHAAAALLASTAMARGESLQKSSASVLRR